MVLVSPLIEHLSGELRAIVDDDPPGSSSLHAQYCSSTRITRNAGSEVSSSMASPGVPGDRSSSLGWSILRVKASSIDKVRSLRPPRQRIVEKIPCPDLIRMRRSCH